jgi:hypothetical protein
VAGVQQQRGRDRGVDPAGQRDDDAGHRGQPAAARSASPASGTWLSISSG